MIAAGGMPREKWEQMGGRAASACPDTRFRLAIVRHGGACVVTRRLLPPLAPLLCASLPFVCRADVTAEPYSSRPTPSELACARQWKQTLLNQDNAADERYAADLPLSFKYGEQGSRDRVAVATTVIESCGRQRDMLRTNRLSWRDSETFRNCEMRLTISTIELLR